MKSCMLTVLLIMVKVCMTFLLVELNEEGRLQLWLVLQRDYLDCVQKGWWKDRKVLIYASCLKVVEIFSYFPVLIRIFWKKEKRGYRCPGKSLVKLYPNHLSYSTSSVVDLVSTFACCWTVSSKSILSKGNDPGLYRKRKSQEIKHFGSPFL